jgi:PPOX class probable FMN-dependent enzyme
MPQISRLDTLRALYREPTERAVRKQLDRLDAHCRRYISLSPFLVMASADGEGQLDASPRGGDPGFVKVVDDRTIVIPDAPGNNRLDSLQNLVRSPGVGLLFMIPGMDETLRINGSASLSTDDALLDLCTNERRRPPLVIEVRVRDAYLHCAKALMRSKLWHPEAAVERGVMPSMGQMIKDQIGSSEAPESQDAMAARYQKDL